MPVPQGGDTKGYHVIRGPHVTEKASVLSSLGKYVFRVTPRANRVEIRRAVEGMYKVKVAHVHILTMPAKFRQVGRHAGRRSGFRKAVVTLQPGQKIDIA